MRFSHLLYSISLLSMTLPSNLAASPPRRPNLYKWLAQNSYICDPTLLNKRSHRFLAPRESVRSKCSCGDPLVTRAACGTRNGTRQKPKCFRLPESCLHEYTVLFDNAGNRMSNNPSIAHRPTKPSLKAPKTRPSGKRRILTKKRPPKIVSTVTVATILRVRKPKGKSGR